MKYLIGAACWLFSITTAFAQTKPAQASSITHIVFTSDVHYGFERKEFRGAKDVQSKVANDAMIAQINKLPGEILPADNGAASGQAVQNIDYLAITGDICNRQQVFSDGDSFQSATASWKQFTKAYFNKLTIKGKDGANAKLLLVPGNHDVSNAIGYYKPMKPLTDNASMVGIYNLMMHPAVPKTSATYNYKKDRINYAKDIAGVHCLFINLWPDVAMRTWMEQDLKSVKPNVPVLIFTHDPPNGDVHHFINPFVPHTINPKDGFENLLSDQLQEDTLSDPLVNDIEQRAFVKFLQAHRNIKAYFHGHENWNEYYTYEGPDHNVSLPVFRVDSPMKGKVSAKDETQLSFQLISIDPRKQLLTVREVYWNAKPKKNGGKLQWGDSKSVSLR